MDVLRALPRFYLSKKEKRSLRRGWEYKELMDDRERAWRAPWKKGL